MKSELSDLLLERHPTGYLNLKDFKELVKKQNTQGIKKVFEDAGVEVFTFGKGGRDYFVKVTDIHKVFFAAFIMYGYRHPFVFKLTYSSPPSFVKSKFNSEVALKLNVKIKGLKYGDVLKLIEYIVAFPEKCRACMAWQP